MLNLNSPFHFNTHFKVNCVLWVVVFSYVTKKKLAPNHRVYLDSEPQCIMGRQMGHLLPRHMLTCTTCIQMACIFVWVQQRPLLEFCYSQKTLWHSNTWCSIVHSLVTEEGSGTRLHFSTSQYLIHFSFNSKHSLKECQF